MRKLHLYIITMLFAASACIRPEAPNCEADILGCSLPEELLLRADDARAADIIKNWLRTRSTIEFLGTLEAIYNPGFKVVEFDHFRKEAGLPTFTLSVSNWIEKTGAISPVFKLYKRILSKVNYEIHTDAVRDFIVPQLMEESQIKFAYTSEADMLNLSLFHYTAKQRHSLTEMFQQYKFSNAQQSYYQVFTTLS